MDQEARFESLLRGRAPAHRPDRQFPPPAEAAPDPPDSGEPSPGAAAAASAGELGGAGRLDGFPEQGVSRGSQLRGGEAAAAAAVVAAAGVMGDGDAAGAAERRPGGRLIPLPQKRRQQRSGGRRCGEPAARAATGNEG